MKTLTLSEALKIKFSNDYSAKQLINTKNLFDEIIKFYPSECFCYVSDDRFEYSKIYLKNDICKLIINFDSYKKKYRIYMDENFDNLSRYDIDSVKESYTEPKNIGKLTTKKIEDWINYYNLVFNALKIKSESTNNSVSEFLESLKDWFSKTQGEIIKNGIIFRFTIHPGYIEKNIKLEYNDGSLETFKKLSNNEYTL